MIANTISAFRYFMILLGVGVLLTGCYQAHSDDDLRTVPVTNNPQLVPGGGMGNFSAMGY